MLREVWFKRSKVVFQGGMKRIISVYVSIDSVLKSIRVSMTLRVILNDEN